MITSELRFLDVVSGNCKARVCDSALAFLLGVNQGQCGCCDEHSRDKNDCYLHSANSRSIWFKSRCNSIIRRRAVNCLLFADGSIRDGGLGCFGRQLNSTLGKSSKLISI